MTGSGTGSFATSIADNVVDDAELVNALTYTGALSVGNLTISDTNVPLTGASFTFDFNGKEYSIYHPYLIIRKLSN